MNKKSTLSQSTCGTECDSGVSPSSAQPEYRVEKREDGVALHLALPGVPKEKLQVSTEKGLLTISGERTTDRPEDWKVVRDLNQPDSYKLAVRLHSDLDPSTIKANLALGVLSLQIDRHEAAKPQTIEVK